MKRVTFQATCFDFPAVCINWCLHFSQVKAFAMLTDKLNIIVIDFVLAGMIEPGGLKSEIKISNLNIWKRHSQRLTG